MFHNSHFRSGLLFCLESLPTLAETFMGGVTLWPSDAFAHTKHCYWTQKLRLPFGRGATAGRAAQSNTLHQR